MRHEATSGERVLFDLRSRPRWSPASSTGCERGARTPPTLSTTQALITPADPASGQGFPASPPRGTTAVARGRLALCGVAGLGPLIIAGPIWFVFRLGLMPVLQYPVVWDVPPVTDILSLPSSATGILYTYGNRFPGDLIWVAALTGMVVALLVIVAVSSDKTRSGARHVPDGLVTAITALRLTTAILTTLAAAWSIVLTTGATYYATIDKLWAMWLPLSLVATAIVLYLPLKARQQPQFALASTAPPGLAGQPPTAWSGAPSAAAYSPTSPYPVYATRPVGATNGLAISAMVCGIAGLLSCAFTSVLAIIFGHIALHQIKRSGNTQSGRGMAITGLVLGYLVIALGVIAYIWLVSIGNSSRY